MTANLQTIAAAKAAAIAAQSITGEPPEIKYLDDGTAYFSFSPAAQKKIADILEGRGPSSPVKIGVQWEPIIIPMVVKKVFPFVALAGAVGYLIGRGRR